MKRFCSVVLLAGLATSCTVHQSTHRPPPPAAPRPVIERPPQPRVAAPAPGLYALDEALADALSGPLQYIDTGPWHNIQRLHACAYRNDRVLVVNVYCSIKEATAARIDIYSPTRGYVRLYAEASSPISQLDRRDYFSFKGDSQPPPPPELWLPPVLLTMSLPELQAYERRRYESFLPACYGGMEANRPQGGCLGNLAPEAKRWRRRNQPFLDQPPAEWYRLLAELRQLAIQHGRNR